MNNPRNCFYEFGRFRLDATRRLLLCEGEPAPLTPKVFDTLLALVRNRDRVMGKDELMREVWSEAVVEEGGLARNISMLRRALGENLAERRYIVTVPGRGYQFVAEVREWQEEEPPLPPLPPLIIEKHTISQVVIEEDDPAWDKMPSCPTQSLAESPAQPPRALTAPARHFSITPRQALIVGGALAALAALIPLGLLFWRQPPAKVSQAHSLAVLPFQFLNSADDEGSLGLGLADALITRLGNTGVIAVRSTSAVQTFATAGRDPVEIGRKLGVKAVLDGRMQRAGDQLRLTVQLLRVEDGAPLWGESFDERFTDALAVQKAVSERVAHALTVELTTEQRRWLKKDYTENAAAFEAYVRGRYFWGKQNRESLAKAIGYFQQAIEIDPAYALAWAGIADCYVSLAVPAFMMGIAPEAESVNKARAAAQRAVELDESLPEAHFMLGVTFYLMGDAAARRELERALELNPHLALAHYYYGLVLFMEGRQEEGLAEGQRAREMDPLSAVINTTLGMGFHRLRRYNEAIAQLQKALEIDPNFIRAHWGLGLVYEQQGRFDEAIAEFQKAEQLSNGGSVPLSALGHVYAGAGRRAEAEQMLARLLALHEQNLASPYYIAAVYAGLGDKGQAFVWLEKIRNTQIVTTIRIDQYFDSLRDDPRFASLLRR
ncbi:MAG: tetratricopeptide repeat protein [Blastocatellales bacterium]